MLSLVSINTVPYRKPQYRAANSHNILKQTALQPFAAYEYWSMTVLPPASGQQKKYIDIHVQVEDHRILKLEKLPNICINN